MKLGRIVKPKSDFANRITGLNCTKAATGAVMIHGNSFPEGFYEALLSVIKEGYPGKEIRPLTDAELNAIDRDMQELAHLQGDNPVDRKTETDAFLQEIIRVTLENSGLQFEE